MSFNEPTTLIELTSVDKSAEARTRPEKELRCAMYKGTFIRQTKIYKGAFCTDVQWQKAEEK